MQKNYQPTAACQFLIASNCLMFAFRLMGFFPEATLAYGIFQTIGLPLYILFSVVFGKQGNNFSGNLMIIFGIMFYGELGIVNIISSAGISTDTCILGIPFIVCGIAATLAMIPLRYDAAVSFISWFTLHIWMLFTGIWFLLPDSYILYLVNVIFGLLDGVLFTYMCAAELTKTVGWNLPMGRPMFGRKYASDEN